MSEIAYEDVVTAVEAATLVRVENLDTVISTDEEESVGDYYWQADVGDPVNATIQVSGKDQDEALANLTNASWEIVQNRQAAQTAAAEPVDPPESYSTEQFTGFSKKALESDYPPEFAEKK